MKLRELRKKSLAGFLAAAMVMTSANVVSAAPNDGTDASQDVSEETVAAESTDASESNSEVPEDAEEASETPEEETDENYDALEESVKNSSITRDGKVRVSIVVDQASTLGRGYSTEGIAKNADAMSYRQQALSAQQALQNKISRQALNGADLDVVWNITLAGNMISAWVPVDALSEIADVDGVAEVIDRGDQIRGSENRLRRYSKTSDDYLR